MATSHPLDGAYERVSRANFHLRELNGCVQTVLDAVKNKISTYEQHIASQLPLEPGESFSPGGNRRIKMPFVLPQFPIIAGEAVYNLRSALDYLVYELSGNRSGTQFPIEDVKLSKDGKYGFDTRRKTFLNGVAEHHIAAIEKLQPYSGCTWTKTLREISNPDKHRHLTLMVGHWNGSTTYECGPSGSFQDRPEKIVPGRLSPDTDIHISIQDSLDIQFSDGRPVIETLQLLSREVICAIKSFESEVKI